jgi:hypothetical protein
MMILCFFLEGTAHFFDAICLLLSSLLAITNAFLRFDNRINLLEIVIIVLICQVNELMGLEEFLVCLFVIVVTNITITHIIGLNVFTGLTTSGTSVVFISPFLKKFND